MPKIRLFINRLSEFQKIICIILILGIVLFLSIGIPTLARYKNRSTLTTVSAWDGSIANSYRKGTGTEADPYIISNGSELAYFSTQLSSNNYDNTYFALGNDIVLNNGVFNYDSANGVQYILSNETYYVGSYSNKYYDNVDRNEAEIGTVNTFDPLEGFKGHFDGGSFTIYGLYITAENKADMGLFTDLQGDIHDLYVENSMIYGGIVTAGIASSTNNASISNVLFNGYVIGRSTDLGKSINTVPSASVVNLQNNEATSYIDLTNNIPFVGSEITSTSITGNYVISGATEAQTSVKINGTTVTNGSFEVDLGNSILNSVAVLTSTTSEDEATLTFSNLRYNIVYNYAVSGGVVAKSKNTSMTNTINKAAVYGYSVSGGLVGVTTSLANINQSYNTGNIISGHVSGGLIGTIEKSSNNITVSKSYNKGDMTATDIGGLIGIINNNEGSISLSDVFNTSTTNYSIGTINNTTVNVTNAYFVSGEEAVKNGAINGSFASTSIINLKTKSYDISNLLLDEFVSFDDLATNNQDVWIYEDGALPILFVDDISNPIAIIRAGTHSWNNLSYEISTIRLDSNITFSIEAADSLRPIKEKYYYVSNSMTPLTEQEISAISTWHSYSDIVQISEEGFYVIYVKVVDYDDNVTYMNTDLLVLDKSGSTASISVGDRTWSSLRDNLDYLYIDRPQVATIEASDDLSGIASVKYYITNQILSTGDLNALADNNWTTYASGIPINEVGKYVIYVKVMDKCNYVTYVNSDYIVLNGYTESGLTIGRNPTSYSNADSYITGKSTITLNISYSNTSSELNDYTHNLMSSILLPQGTKITLIDNVTDKVYEYQIIDGADIYNYNNSCDLGDLDCIKEATYPFTLFNEVGTGAVNKPFSEKTYYSNGEVNEDFTIVLDFSNTSMVPNYNNVSLYMELHDLNGKNVRPTLYNTLKVFNIYSSVNGENSNASLYITTNYSGNTISYNSDSLTNVSITSGINYKYVNGLKIIDTSYEDKEIGLSIKLVDSDGNVVDKSYLKNIIFKIGDKEYYPEEDNIVHVNLENGIADITKILTIVTSADNSNLEEGTYYFKIANYVSNDGKYYDELNNTGLSIPVSVSDNNANIKYSFDVTMDDTNRIISKINNEVNVSFSILQKGSLKHPNIKVSLYKKDQLTAYDQDYSIVDLATYVSNSLNSYASNVYYVSTNPSRNTDFALDLVTANFENTGYKFVFELYDGTKKIGTIEKYFIVK